MSFANNKTGSLIGSRMITMIIWYRNMYSAGGSRLKGVQRSVQSIAGMNYKY